MLRRSAAGESFGCIIAESESEGSCGALDPIAVGTSGYILDAGGALRAAWVERTQRKDSSVQPYLLPMVTRLGPEEV